MNRQIQERLSALLPNGFTPRELVIDDAPIAARLWSDYMRHAGYPKQANPDEVRSDWTAPNYSIRDSGVGVVSPDGELIAYCTLWDLNNPPVRNFLDWAVHPDFVAQGIEDFLLAWGLALTERVFEQCPDDAEIVLGASAIPTYGSRTDAYSKAGFELARHFLEMRIDMDTPPSPAQVPDGYRIRHFHYPAELERMTIVIEDTFKDHFGHVDTPIPEVMARWQHFFDTYPPFTEEMIFFVEDTTTDEVVGCAMCVLDDPTDPSVGCVVELGIMKDHRNRGLALALLYHAFGEFYRRGKPSVVLIVDGASLTGAVRLYERAGMRQTMIRATYGKVLRAGTTMYRR